MKFSCGHTDDKVLESMENSDLTTKHTRDTKDIL